MQALAQGRFLARLAQGPEDLARAQGLRHLAFRSGAAGLDADRFDAVSQHVLVLDRDTDALLCCFRVQALTGATVGTGYGAQFYDLSPLAGFTGPMLEMGRFCLHPDCHQADVLRLAWGAVARIVEARGVALLFGCTSLQGADPLRHAAALGALRPHIGPARWRPGRRALEAVDLADCTAPPDATRLPALLRSYLAMGAWVSDHAVIDRAMDTLHVLTALDIAAIPPARARALRAIGAGIVG